MHANRYIYICIYIYMYMYVCIHTSREHTLWAPGVGPFDWVAGLLLGLLLARLSSSSTCIMQSRLRNKILGE